MVNSGTVVSIELNAPIKKKDGGSYKGYRIVYNDNGEIKKIEKAMASLNFGNGANVAKVLNDLAVGEDFTVTMNKNDAGFWDVSDIQKGKAEDVTLPAQAANSATNSTGVRGGKVLGSTYETPEERKLKQRLIVRQAALNQALDLAKVGGYKGKEQVVQDDVFAAAEFFEGWVYRGLE